MSSLFTFHDVYDPAKYVSTRDELSAHLKKFWEKMDVINASSDWSDREPHIMTLDQKDESLKRMLKLLGPAGSSKPFINMIQETFGNTGSNT